MYKGNLGEQPSLLQPIEKQEGSLPLHIRALPDSDEAPILPLQHDWKATFEVGGISVITENLASRKLDGTRRLRIQISEIHHELTVLRDGTVEEDDVEIPFNALHDRDWSKIDAGDPMIPCGFYGMPLNTSGKALIMPPNCQVDLPGKLLRQIRTKQNGIPIFWVDGYCELDLSIPYERRAGSLNEAFNRRARCFDQLVELIPDPSAPTEGAGS